jgi:hypothetical protein
LDKPNLEKIDVKNLETEEWQKIESKPINIGNANKEEENKRIFMSDKKVYKHINKDITTHIIGEDDINPMFIDKFYIFKILDERGKINFQNNENINLEMEHFRELYDALQDNKEESLSSSQEDPRLQPCSSHEEDPRLQPCLFHEEDPRLLPCPSHEEDHLLLSDEDRQISEDDKIFNMTPFQEELNPINKNS